MNNPRSTRGSGDERSRTPADSQTTTQNASMETWSEPPLKSLAPSFKEYPHLNIERHGVLQEMAPLGTLPSSKLKKAVRQGTPKPTIAIKNVEEPTPTVEIVQEPLTPEPVVEERATPEPQETEEPEYIPRTPQAQTSHRKNYSQSSIRGQTPPTQMSPSMSLSPVKHDSSSQRIDKVVNAAVRRALSEGRYPTAYALRTLYDEFTGVARISNLIELVFYKGANAEQQAEFQRLISHKKKEGRKDGKAVAFFKERGHNTAPRSPMFSRSYSVTSPSKTASVATGHASSMSPHKDISHLAKRHKGTEYRSPFPPITAANIGIIFPPLPSRDQTVQPVPQQNGAVNGRGSRVRSVSESSGSSLSSLDEEILREGLVSPQSKSSKHPKKSKKVLGGQSNGEVNDESGQASHDPSQLTSHAKSHANNTTEDNLAPAPNSNQNEPMTKSTSLGPKLHAFPTSTTSTTTKNPITSSDSTPSATLQVANNDSHMAASLEDPIHISSTPLQFPSLLPSHTLTLPSHPTKTFQTKLKFGKKAPEKAKQAPAVEETEEEKEATATLKRKAKEITESQEGIKESFVRAKLLRRQDKKSRVEAPEDPVTAVSAPAVKSGQTLRIRPAQSKKKVNDDFEELSSPTFPVLQAELGRGSTPNSRAGTPNASSRLSRKAKTTGPRMKTSPMKNKAGPSAGIPRASGERNSPVGGNGALPNGQDDNEDYCSSCSGIGELVCCDGCIRSFHLKCVDPPMIEDHLPDTWFCNVCRAKDGPTIKEQQGPFGKVIALLEKSNSRAFGLPEYIRNYFDGVRTGSEGEYEEGPPPGPVSKAKNRNGYDEAPDYLKQRDAKGNLILCHDCKDGPGTNRPIIACSYCSATWHLDCLNPPMANPPPLQRQWRCPLHVDDLLAKVPAALGPAHRFRRIKGSIAIKPDIPRGTKNNGHIEIDFEPSEDEKEGFFERKEFGHVYRLPEDGVKLDFLAKLRSIPSPPRRKVVAQRQQSQPATISIGESRHSIAEKQAALNLAALAGTIQTDNDEAQILIDVLMTEAPQSVIDLIAQGPATDHAERKPTSKKERQSLKAMMALIQRKLDEAQSEEEKEEEELVREVNDTQVKAEAKSQDEDADMLL